MDTDTHERAHKNKTLQVNRAFRNATLDNEFLSPNVTPFEMNLTAGRLGIYANIISGSFCVSLLRLIQKSIPWIRLHILIIGQEGLYLGKPTVTLFRTKEQINE